MRSLLAAMVIAATTAAYGGTYYSVDGAGNVMRHTDAETPYPSGSIVDSAGTYAKTPTDQLTATGGRLRLRTVTEFAAWRADQEPEVRQRSLQFTGPARVEVSATDGHVYGLEVDPAGDEVIPVQRESTRLTHAQYEAARDAIFAARKATRDTAKAELDALKAKLATAEAEVAALKTKAATAEADMAAMKVDLDKLKAGKP